MTASDLPPLVVPDPAGLPVQTDDLRTGPELHPALLGLLPLLGTWLGTGRGGYRTVPDFDFAQRIRFCHDGRPFLAYESRTWAIDAQGGAGRPLARECGFWRPVIGSDGRPTDEIEALLNHATGLCEVLVGRIAGTRFELASDVVVRTATAKEVTATRRLYGLVSGDLLWAFDMAAVGQEMQPHLSGRLRRVSRTTPSSTAQL